MSVPYRAQFRLDQNDDAVRVASEQFRAWLREKTQGRYATVTNWDWSGDGVHAVGPSALLQVVTQEGDDGGRRQLLELREIGPTGVWTTRLYSASLPSAKRLKQSLWLTTDSADGVTPKPPRLARRLLEATDVWNGDVPVRAAPDIIDLDQVDRLYGYLVDENRDLSIVVAAPLGVEVSTWRDALTSLVKDSLGVATAFVLTESAFDALNERLPDSHGLEPGTVRTYLPRLDPDDPSDARRHRFLGARTMAREFQNGRFSPWLVERHSRAAREHLALASLPPELGRVESILEKLRLEQLRTSEGFAEAAPPVVAAEPEPEISLHEEQNPSFPLDDVSPQHAGLLTRVLTVVQRFTPFTIVDDDSISELERRLARGDQESARSTEQINSLLDRQSEIAAERDRLRRQLEDEQLEREIAESDRREAERRYRSILQWKRERSIDEYVPEPGAPEAWEEPPSDVAELVLRFDDPAYSGVTDSVVLMDIDKAYARATEIDERDTIGRYGAAFWEYILILRDYAIASHAGFQGSVHDYLLADAVDGRKCSPVRHKATESEQVSANSKWRKARTFSVPKTVDARGIIYMDAHFAPTHRDTYAPRMHYHSDVAGSGKIYIGYIGRHLPNTKTN